MTKYRQKEYLAFLEDRPIITDVKVMMTLLKSCGLSVAWRMMHQGGGS